MARGCLSFSWEVNLRESSTQLSPKLVRVRKRRRKIVERTKIIADLLKPFYNSIIEGIKIDQI